ncbi:hypothetical protein ACN42_g5033 [Penicillium freii]|uniref:Uncharacterized protein n=1 Tax=Penicillium freii TaxID=48697 RepID=A0A101MK60_PENFR|nr:hypothetical protein ACN42_g5033 [Penicillium freii]
MYAPLWVWLFGQKEHSLRNLYRGLRCMQPGYISNQCADIDLHPMDFWTGNSDPSLIQFFTPDTDTNFKIANTALDPEDPVDDPFTHFRSTSANPPGGSNTPIFWELVPMYGEDSSLFNSNDQHGFTIQMGATSADGKSAHQLVVMKSDKCYHDTLPSVGELIVLV